MATRDRGSETEIDADLSAVSVSDAVIVRTAGVDRAGEMYRCFLASQYPEALAIAEEVLRDRPDDFMALAIVDECRRGVSAATSEAPESTSGAVTIPSPAPEPRDSDLPTAEMDADLTAAYLGIGPPGDRGRQMCQRFLESDHPAALALAEQILAVDPDDKMACAIAEQCRAAIEELVAGTLSADSLDIEFEDL
jgi:hypothetical protein